MGRWTTWTGIVVVAAAVGGCGGGGEVPAAATANDLGEVRDPALVGDWVLAGFHVTDYTDGWDVTQDDFASWQGALTLAADGRAGWSLCIDGRCHYGTFRWQASDGVFYENGIAASYTVDVDVLEIAWEGIADDGHAMREVKTFTRSPVPFPTEAAATGLEATDGLVTLSSAGAALVW
jgi:hypothetical protein